MLRPVQMAHWMLSEVIGTGDIAVDATMGNGWDTAFLAELTDKVYAFDVQEAALNSTQEFLQEKGLTAELILDGHENVRKYIKEPIKGAIFNLGYLPRTDKSVTTHAGTTLQALESLTELLLPGGRIMLVIYYGHEGGEIEKEAVLDWAKALPQAQWHVMKYSPLNQIHTPPLLVCIEKR